MMMTGLSEENDLSDKAHFVSLGTSTNYANSDSNITHKSLETRGDKGAALVDLAFSRACDVVRFERCNEEYDDGVGGNN